MRIASAKAKRPKDVKVFTIMSATLKCMEFRINEVRYTLHFCSVKHNIPDCHS